MTIERPGAHGGTRFISVRSMTWHVSSFVIRSSARFAEPRCGALGPSALLMASCLPGFLLTHVHAHSRNIGLLYTTFFLRSAIFAQKESCNPHATGDNYSGSRPVTVVLPRHGNDARIGRHRCSHPLLNFVHLLRNNLRRRPRGRSACFGFDDFARIVTPAKGLAT